MTLLQNLIRFNGGLADTEEVLNMYFIRNMNALASKYQGNIWLYGVNVFYTAD